MCNTMLVVVGFAMVPVVVMAGYAQKVSRNGLRRASASQEGPVGVCSP